MPGAGSWGASGGRKEGVGSVGSVGSLSSVGSVGKGCSGGNIETVALLFNVWVVWGARSDP